MVKCYLCKEPIKVTRDKHYYDEKLKKRYHMKCFAGICPECSKPVNKKRKHVAYGGKVYHANCAPRENPQRPTKEFWDNVYPKVLKYAKGRFKDKARAEEYARATTGYIWYKSMGKSRKAYYKKKAAKRERRRNPAPIRTAEMRDIMRDILMQSSWPAEVVEQLSDDELDQLIDFGELNDQLIRLTADEGTWTGIPPVEDPATAQAIKKALLYPEEMNPAPTPPSQEGSRFDDIWMRAMMKEPSHRRTNPRTPTGRKNPKKKPIEDTLTASEMKMLCRSFKKWQDSEDSQAMDEFVEAASWMLDDSTEVGHLFQKWREAETLSAESKYYDQFLRVADKTLRRNPSDEWQKEAKEHPTLPTHVIDQIVADHARENPILMTPDQEEDTYDAFVRVQEHKGSREDIELLEAVKRAGGAYFGVGPSYLTKKRKNPEDDRKRQYEVVDEDTGETVETGVGTVSEAEAHAALLSSERSGAPMTVRYPTGYKVV